MFAAHQRSRQYCCPACQGYTHWARYSGQCIICHALIDPNLQDDFDGRMRAMASPLDARRAFAAEHAGCNRRRLDRNGRSTYCTCQHCKKEREARGEPERPVIGTPPARRSTAYRKHAQVVYERDGYACQICGLPTDPDADPLSDLYPTLDHDIPVSWGGSGEPSNLQTAHRICNIDKRDYY